LNLSIDFLERREGQKRRAPVVFDAGLYQKAMEKSNLSAWFLAISED
jgi:hypothetical protein